MLEINTRQALDNLGNRWRNRTIRGIVSSTDPYGSPFKPNKQSTIRRKKSSKPLIDKGTLKDSIGYRLFGDHILVLGVGPAAPYGIHHLYGTKRIPQRMFLPIEGLPESWQRDAAKELDRNITLKIDDKEFRI